MKEGRCCLFNENIHDNIVGSTAQPYIMCNSFMKVPCSFGAWLIVLPGLLLCFGCSDPPLSGTVKYSDGTPVEAGTVVLQSSQSQGIGAIRPDGSFDVYQYKPCDGLKRGEYKVYFQGAFRTNEETGSILYHLVPEKYRDQNTSGLTYDSSSGNRLDIVIECENPKMQRRR